MYSFLEAHRYSTDRTLVHGYTLLLQTPSMQAVQTYQISSTTGMMEIQNIVKVTNTVSSKVLVSVKVLKATTDIKMEAPSKYFHTD
jgi:hypothetical protein